MRGKMCRLFFSDFRERAENAIQCQIGTYELLLTQTIWRVTREIARKANIGKSNFIISRTNVSIESIVLIERSDWEPKREKTWVFPCTLYIFWLFLAVFNAKIFYSYFPLTDFILRILLIFLSEIETGILNFSYENMNVDSEIWYFINIYFL